MTRRRYLYVEAAVAAVVLVVLLLVMIPKWQRAQVAGRSAQALRDLAMLARALEAYNLEHFGLPLLGRISVQGKLEEEPCTIELSILESRLRATPQNQPTGIHELEALLDEGGIEPNALYIGVIYLRWPSFSGDPITPYLEFMPDPPPALRLPGMQSIRGNYVLSTFAMRSYVQRSTTVHIPWWSRFNHEKPRDLLGVYRGPVQKAHRLGLPYVWYDPTNGLLSHGYIVYYDGREKPHNVNELWEALLDRHPNVRDHMERSRRGRAGWIEYNQNFDAESR